MHQTKKGNQWHFGMKAHIGVDAESGLVHTVIGTAANVDDVTQAGALLHGEETVAFGDAGYRGVDKREEARAPHWHVAMQPGKRRALGPDKQVGAAAGAGRAAQGQRARQGRAPVPCGQEPVPPEKVRYKGLAKNQAQLFSLFGLANLVIAKRRLLLLQARAS